MRIAHTALWTPNLDAAADFWKTYFGATIGEAYRSSRRPGFISRFVSLPESSDHIELMTGPWLPLDPHDERIGWDHIAISLGSKMAVDALAERCKADGFLKSAPRMTCDGVYEAVIAMPEGTPIEITI